MARPPHPGPTERELTLFKILWNLGPSTVRRIREAFPAQRRPAHTSVQTNLQGMLEKGYVTRQTGEPGHVYAAALSREEVERSAVRDLLGRVFDGSALRLITTVLQQDQASPAELRRLQAALEEAARD